MATISIENRGPQRFWMVQKVFVPMNDMVSMSPEEAKLLVNNALELQKPSPTPQGFRTNPLPDGNVGVVNVTDGAFSRDLDFNVPKVLLKGGSKRNPVVTEVEEEALIELFQDKKARHEFLALRGQDQGLLCTLPNKPPFNTFAGVK